LLQENSRKVAAMGMLVQRDRFVTAAKDQPFSAEKITGWIVS
jgi:hypothetical protein